jgi:hypothetical protein
MTWRESLLVEEPVFPMVLTMTKFCEGVFVHYWHAQVPLVWEKGHHCRMTFSVTL